MAVAQLFYFHVGGDGAKRDFPRSLARKITAQELGPHLERDIGRERAEKLSTDLTGEFPDGFNCWGIPSGGEHVFRSITRGDIVLLVGQLQLQPYADGNFEYAGIVKLAPPEHLFSTSRYVWTESRFPLMFFFDAIEISLPWPVFLRDVGYNPRMDPHGRGARVNPQRYSQLPGGSVEDYLQHIRRQYP